MNHTDDLRLIRKMMEESSRFLSLSGISGVFVGLIAIAGAAISYLFVLDGEPAARLAIFPSLNSGNNGTVLVIIALLVLVSAISVAALFAGGESRKRGANIWSPVTRLLIFNVAIPLATGGIVILMLILNGNFGLVVPSMLIFYGLALFNGGKFTFGEVQYLGILEIVTGIAAMIVGGYDLLFWVAGFGLLHIMYGFILHRKYS